MELRRNSELGTRSVWHGKHGRLNCPTPKITWLVPDSPSKEQAFFENPPKSIRLVRRLFESNGHARGHFQLPTSSTSIAARRSLLGLLFECISHKTLTTPPSLHFAWGYIFCSSARLSVSIRRLGRSLRRCSPCRASPVAPVAAAVAIVAAVKRALLDSVFFFSLLGRGERE